MHVQKMLYFGEIDGEMIFVVLLVQNDQQVSLF